MEWHPLTFKPILKAKTWGGRRLATLVGKDLPPDEQIGESWEVSDYPGDVSVVAEGPLAGRSLHELAANESGWLLGGCPAEGHDRFPILAKFIDAHDILSLQVHPTDDLARQMGGDERGKTEAYYVIEARPDAWMYLGTRPGVTRDDVADALDSEDRERIEGVLNRLPVRAGDFIYAPAGTVHAIGAGMVFAETSQTSDSTLRLYDWGRLPRRSTHIPQGLAAMHFPPDGLGDAGKRVASFAGHHLARLVGCHAFSVFQLQVPAGRNLKMSGSTACTLWMTVLGRATLGYESGSLTLTPGRSLLLPAGPYAVNLAADEDTVILSVSLPG